MTYQPVTEKTKCIVDGCENRTIGERCITCRSAKSKLSKVCATPECGNAVRTNQYCGTCLKPVTKKILNPCSTSGCIRKSHGPHCAVCVNKQAADKRRAEKQALREAEEREHEQQIIDELIETLEGYGYTVDKVKKIVSAISK
jgi:hypothetical protein